MKKHRAFVFVLAAAMLTVTASAVTARQASTDALYQDSRRLFESLDYENAVKSLDQLIAALLAAPPTDAAGRDRLASAYEMRARSKFGLGSPDEARADFVSLLRINPNYALTGQVSPRVVTLFDETAAQTVTNLGLSVTPGTARVLVDDIPIPTSGPVRVTAGDHVITAEQRGYRAVKQNFTAKPGETAVVSVTLERVSAVIYILTSPVDVDVSLDGVKLGKSSAGPLPPEMSEAVAKAGVSPGSVSAPIIVSDVVPGVHTLDLARDCYVRVTNKISVDTPEDFTVGPVVLKPAVATLTVNANEPKAQVFIDGADRGIVPLTVPDLCEGAHVIELRSRFGRDSRRVEARAGEPITFDGVLKPAFGIVSASGDAGNLDLDARVIVERTLGSASTVRLLATPPAQTDQLLKANQLPASWLASDAEGKPVGAALQLSRPVRADASTKLADALGMQGVASVTALDRTRIIVSLLASGIGTPDTIELRLDRPDTIAAAVAKLDRVTPLTQSTLGLVAIDVADVNGPVVVSVEANGPANGKIQPGDSIVSVGGQPVADVAALAKVVSTRQPGKPIAVELKDAKGTARKADVDVVSTPRLISLSDQTVLFNRTLVDLRAQLAAASDPFQQSVIRLNTAVALARLGECAVARDELKQVQLPDRPGVGTGTVQYLLGVCAEQLGNRAEAEAAYRAAAATESLLTEDGPPVKELAEAKLAQLNRPSGR